jgi:conjugative relaxase-like TrwC/TraI family protein
MLSLQTITHSATAGHYYEKDNYYTDREEARVCSVWWGQGAMRLGLSGPVDQETFQRVLDGQLPNGEEIRSGTLGRDRAGVDVTLSAPKSLSLLAEVGGDHRLREAHEVAVTRALEYLEQEAAQARLTVDGETSTEKTGNFIVARFQHDTSRMFDPQLHTHAVIANATERQDGAWRALSNEKLYEHKMAAGAIYRAQLAAEVQRLGYDIEKTHADGRFEIRGFTKKQLEHFSQRSLTIREAMQEHGLSGAKAAERATLMTRTAKSSVDRVELREDWRTRAESQGIDLAHMMEQARERAGRESTRYETQQVARAGLQWAIEHTTERQSVVARRDLERYATEQVVGTATYQDVQRAIRQAERSGELIPLGDRYTTFEALKTEQDTIRMMAEGQGRVASILSHEQAEQATDGRHLTTGQQRAAIHILASEDRFIGVEGRAGTGKTTMLNVVREYAEQRGYEVRGLAISASAARTLENEAGIRSQTVAQFLAERAGQQREGIQSGKRTLYIVDESSLLGSRDAHAFMKAIEDENARAVFLGDRAQLAAIQSGKPFALLVDKGMKTEQMTEIVRQRTLELKQVVEQAAEGKAAETMAQLENDGRLIAIADRSARLDAIAHEYVHRDRTVQEGTLVLTGSRADRLDLNERIRNGLKEQGVLSGPDIRVEVLVPKDLTKAQMRESTSYELGDVIRFGKDYRSLGVSKGEYGRVVTVQCDSNTVVLQMEHDDRTVEWQPHRYTTVEVYRREERTLLDGDLIRWTRNSYEQDRRNGELVRARLDTESGTILVRDRDGNESLFDPQRDRHWDHGYVSTVHASQGRTVERGIYHADSEQITTNREAWYVALSRAREEVRIYTDDAVTLREAVNESRGQHSAIEAVERHGAGDREHGHRDNLAADRHVASPPRAVELER